MGFARDALSRADVRAAFERLFERAPAGAYDAKRLLRAFRAAGLENARFADDAMIAAHLLDPARGYADIEDAAAQWLGAELPADGAAHADAALQIIAKARAELGRATSSRSTRRSKCRSRRCSQKWKRRA